MTPKQQAFADYYIDLGNAVDTAIKAGYSKNYANAQSYKLLENVGVKKHIGDRMEEIKSKRVADQQEILGTLTAILRGETTSIDVVFLVKYLINQIILEV